MFCPFKKAENPGPCLGIRGQNLTPSFACVCNSSSGTGSRFPWKSVVEAFLKIMARAMIFLWKRQRQRRWQRGNFLQGSTTSSHFLIRRLLPIFQLLIQTMRQSHFLRRLVLIKNFSILYQPPHQLIISIVHENWCSWRSKSSRELAHNSRDISDLTFTSHL